MAKVTAIKGTKANGDKVIAGYKVALRKIDMEKCGFKEGDIVKVEYKKGEVRIIHK